MKLDKSTRIKLGGKSAFNWHIFLIALPIILFETPLSEVGITNGWVFWRWTFATLISIVPLILLYALGDFLFFQDRINKPMPDWLVFAYGFFLGAVFGSTMGFLTFLFRIQNEDLLQQILQRGISNGMAGMLLVPISSLVTSAAEIYREDREALIAERLLVESQKAESKAVIQSLRASLSNKVDENLLKIIENSKDYFDTKSRSLEENWELLAERLRRAALDTIRPFSHTLHRKGEELTYRVQITELASYIAYKFDIYIFLTLLVYLITSHHTYINNNFQSEYLKVLILKIGILFMLLLTLKFVQKLKFTRRLSGFMLVITINSLVFYLSYNLLLSFFGWSNQQIGSGISDAILIATLITLISLVMAFLYGGHAEIDFLERRISEEQLEARLLRREEARISRELAKYLHGTIQSRLMASAIGLESAGRRGDLKALRKEARTAYKNLKLPSESYFSAPQASLKAEIDKVIAKWQNLLEIKVKLPATAPKISSELIQDLGNVINEGFSNSFRHGSAEQVELRIDIKASKIFVLISDNGHGPTKGKAGLGSEWFSAIAGNSWSISENKKGGADLNLEISIT